MPVIGYIPFDAGTISAEAHWVRDRFACDVLIPRDLPRLNGATTAALLPLPAMRDAIRRMVAVDWLIAEGPAGFLWTAALRHHGFAGGATVLPYLNPRRWQDVAAAVLYTRFRDSRDRVYLGSTPSARIYRRLGVPAHVGEPYGIDDRRFRPRPHAAEVLHRLGIPGGRVLLFSGRAQQDKDLYRLLRVALKARILFPDLQIVLASHVIDEAYVATLRRELGPGAAMHFVERPDSDDLADLYCVADVFVTAATSHFETFGRAPAEALACGTPVIAPRYDGFAEVLAQPGGHLVGVEIDESGPHVREDELLRAIYDVLSAPDRIPAAHVSSVAHRRFARSRTIELLAHVVNHEPAEAIDLGEASTALALPPAWERALQRIAALPASAALDYVWTCHGDGGLSDDADVSGAERVFVESVRRALCVTESGPRSHRASAEEPGDAA
jgi:glycosyltransferase involved in cell wall biosynthesis